MVLLMLYLTTHARRYIGMDDSNKGLDIINEAECNPAEINEPIETIDDMKNGVLKIVDDTKGMVEKGMDVVGNAAKTAVSFSGDQLKRARDVMDKVGGNLDESRTKRILEKYQPIFPEDMTTDSINYPKMLNLVDTDKRMNIEECKGAIGFKESVKGVKLMGVYERSLDQFQGIEFYPDASASVYYVHPFQSNKYIQVFEYFKYLKEAKVAELENIAQALGAKHFSVTIYEEAMSKEKVNTKANAMLGIKKDKASSDVGHSDEEKTYEYVGIAAENTYPGKEPELPELMFWANNESIKTLIKQRLDPKNPLKSKKFTLDYNTSSGIKEKDAAKIDGVLKVLKFKAAGSIEKEAQKESKRRFEYEIEF